MNYVLILIDYFPEYIKLVINTILSVDRDANIFLCHNQNKRVSFKNVNEVNLNDIHSNELKEFNQLNIFENTIFEENPLWVTSVQRIFYLNQIINDLNLKNIVHFDNDVLIYKSFSEIGDSFTKSKINITPYNLDKLTFGYCYIENKALSNFLSIETLKLYKYGKANNWDFNNYKPLNEMEVIKQIEIKNKDKFEKLSTLPYQGQVLFDPAGYGQFIDGSHFNPKKFYKSGFTSINDPIGVEIISKRMKVKFVNTPFAYWENNKYEIANLHVHSKRLDKFLPNNYKAYI